MHKLLATILIISISTQAHAGIWDTITGWFGDSPEKSDASEIQSAKAEEMSGKASTTAALAKTGLELLPFIMTKLGVTEGQAKGGLGAILQVSKALSGGNDFDKLASVIPGASSLLAAAPILTGNKSDAMGMAAKLADQSGSAGDALKLVSQFKSLGLGSDMIPKFTETTKEYLNEKGNEEASQLLTSTLSSYL